MRWKITALVLAAVAICAFLLFRPPIDLAPLMTIDSATYVRSGGGEAGEIDLKPVREMMVNAEWISNSPVNKGSYHLRLEGFPDLHVSDFNGYFWVKGRRGFFKVSEMQRREFDDHFHEAIGQLLDPTNGNQMD